MELVSQFSGALVTVAVGLFVTYMVRDRSRHQEQLMRSELDAVKSTLQAQISAVQLHVDALRQTMDARFESVDRQFASVRSDLTQIALAVGAQPRPQAG